MICGICWISLVITSRGSSCLTSDYYRMVKVDPKNSDMEDKNSKTPHQLEMDEQNKVNHETAKKDGSHIECKYMRAAHGFLSNTTFHGITWVLEDFSSYVKVGQ